MLPDVYFDGSFLYYYAREEGLDLANSGQIVNPSGSTYLTTSSVSNGAILSQTFNYQPAFKAGLGANFYEWIVSAEYTWIRQTTRTNRSAPAPVPIVTGIGAWVANNWFEQANATTGQGLAGSAISSKWRLVMDIIDLTAGRPFYEGQNLTISPFFGFRAAWIRQKINVTLDPSPLLTGITSTSVESKNKSNCWGIGPRTGFGASCLLGMGFRLEGDAAVSLLYTSFTHIKHKESSAYASLPGTIGVSQNQTNVIRPELELGCGFGWGTYFFDQQYHIDLSAGYDFSIFWEQNMIRKVLDQTVTGVGSAANNLYLHGLNVSGRIDF
jgi:hypothetical protein